MIVDQLSAGRTLDALPAHKLFVIPKTALAVVQLSAERSDLPHSLEALSTMFQQQAELRLASVQAVLTPLLLLLVAGLIGTVILGLFAPMVSIFRLFG
jgi:type IV pilus assembly protein PilC